MQTASEASALNLELALNRISFRIIKQAVVDYKRNSSNREVISFFNSDYFLSLIDIITEVDGEIYREKIFSGKTLKIPKEI